MKFRFGTQPHRAPSSTRRRIPTLAYGQASNRFAVDATAAVTGPSARGHANCLLAASFSDRLIAGAGVASMADPGPGLARDLRDMQPSQCRPPATVVLARVLSCREFNQVHVRLVPAPTNRRFKALAKGASA